MFDQGRYAWYIFCSHFEQRTAHKCTRKSSKSNKSSWPTCTFIDPTELKQHASCSWQPSEPISTDTKQMSYVCHCLISKWRLLGSLVKVKTPSRGIREMPHIDTSGRSTPNDALNHRQLDTLFRSLSMQTTNEISKIHNAGPFFVIESIKTTSIGRW